MKEIGEINVKLEGATFQETERCRIIIIELFKAGVFNIKSGSATINFDELGHWSSIEIRRIRRPNKSFSTLDNSIQFAIIEPKGEKLPLLSM